MNQSKNANVSQNNRPSSPKTSSNEVLNDLNEDKERRWFCDAFTTEFGDNFAKKISFRELVDVIVCAGKDVTVAELHKIWLYNTGKKNLNKLFFEEAFHIFQQVQPTNYNILYESLSATTLNGELDLKKISTYLEEKITDDSNRNEMEDVLKWFYEKRNQHKGIEDIVCEFENYQTRLREINSKIVNEKNRNVCQSNFLLTKSSSESLSSIFSNNRITESTNNANNTTTQFSGDGGGSLMSSFCESIGDEKVTLKSLIIQQSQNESTCVVYLFTLFRPQHIKINVRINEKNSSLKRFNNHILGYIKSDKSKIYGITKRNENGAMCTNWLKIPAGTYTFELKFCRPLKMIKPKKSDDIVDSKRLLTKTFKVMLMNLFDMFDLDDDGLLSRSEFELYSILSGSGKILDEKWSKINETFELRNNCLSMKTFINMHQAEADTYGSNAYLQDMWIAIRRLGYNSNFFMSTACPIIVEYQLSEGATFSKFQIHESQADAEPCLIDFLWKNSTQLPFFKDFQLIRQFKTDYFAVLIAGKEDKDMRYKLDLTMSNNVNIKGNDLIIEEKVLAHTTKILTIAIAQADGWYLSVKKLLSEPLNESTENTTINNQ